VTVDEIVASIQRVVAKIGRDNIYRFMRGGKYNLIAAAFTTKWVAKSETAVKRLFNLHIFECYQVMIDRNRIVYLPVNYSEEWFEYELCKHLSADAERDIVKSIDTVARINAGIDLNYEIIRKMDKIIAEQ